jgi:hypothetical protein
MNIKSQILGKVEVKGCIKTGLVIITLNYEKNMLELMI